MSLKTQYAPLALEACKRASAVIMGYYNKDLKIDWKSDNSPVTIADKKSEDTVREFLARETPEFGFIGEESGRCQPQAEFQWILDPIDGTKSFIHGVPLFGSLLGLLRGGVPVAGVISLPALSSVLWAEAGQGAWLDGVRVRVSQVAELSQSLVLSGTINTMEDKGYGEGFARVRKGARLYRGWGDCYGYYLVASGRAEVMVDPVVSIWDIAPLPVIFSEAGGRFSLFDGSTNILLPDGEIARTEFTGMASNGNLHNEVLGLLQG